MSSEIANNKALSEKNLNSHIMLINIELCVVYCTVVDIKQFVTLYLQIVKVARNEKEDTPYLQ